MAYKVIITLLVCAVIMPGAVRSAPNRSKQEVASHQSDDVSAVTSSSLSIVRQSNELEPVDPSGASESGPSRTKRAIIFRPLFVYRQQEIKKQKLKEMRQQNQQQQNQQSAPCAACQQQQASRKPVQYYAQKYPYQRS